MFESAELGHAVDKAKYKKEEPKLRAELLAAQYEVLNLKKFPVVVLVGGVEGAGRGEIVNTLNEWMDPRHIRTRALAEPTDEERERPRMWRYWRALPPKGKIGIFLGSWYTEPIIDRVYGLTKDADLEARISEITHFEQMLVDEGALVLKFWIHLSKASQKKRLKTLEKDKRTRWRVTMRDWKHFALYDKFRKVSEKTLRETSTGEAPWVVIEGTDARYRMLTVGRELLSAIRARVDAESDKSEKAEKKSNGHAKKSIAPKEGAVVRPREDDLDVIGALDLSKKLTKNEFDDAFANLQARLAMLTRGKKFRERSLVLGFEGSDAAGKGGSIRRVTASLDARSYHVVPIAAPTEEERAFPYLWRFWRDQPRRAHAAIFDRTWYGRVLVERVEGFCAPADWMRAYAEINAFEEQLVENGSVVCKFWLQISAEEQLKRFKEREQIGFKRYKITDEDWRNRKKWDAYAEAASDMIDRTSTDVAPWTLIEAEDKNYARIKVLRTIVEALEAQL